MTSTSTRLVAKDDEYTLFGVVIFKRVHDDFVQKCRENKYIVRDFAYSEQLLEQQREELATADTTEKELWVCYFRFTQADILTTRF